MPNYHRIQFIGYGCVTSEPTRVLEANTNSPFRKDAETRARTLCDVADWTREAFDDAIEGPDTLKVFMAPEFYFRFGGPATSDRMLRDSYPDGDILLPNITGEILRRRLTRPEYTDWLIVPGTMFWHQPAADPDATHPTYFNTVLVVRGGPAGELTPEDTAGNERARAVPMMAGLSSHQKQLMSTIDYAQGQAGVDNARWDAALNPMFQPVPGDWDWWRWHAFTVQGVTGPSGRPITFGLEVSVEHVDGNEPGGPGVLRTLERNYSRHCQGPVPRIDVHLVPSCGTSLDPAVGVTARVNGVAAICDGTAPKTDAPWPTAYCERVDGITATRARVTSPAGEPMLTRQLPAHLQVGAVGHRHDPPDAIGLSQPIDLPT
jgi:hypothetical protein